jgi:serine/threonine protein kinase
MRRPSIVGKEVGYGIDSTVAILRDDSTRVLKYCQPDEEDSVQNLENEKRILRILGHHPFIVHLHSLSERGLVFEYYQHKSLRDYYQTLLALPSLDDRVRWCQQATKGFAYIHSKGILHNDISARNILLASDLTIKICDFGFSTLNDTAAIMVGTAETRYSRCSPVVSTKPCVADDVFAIGSLFFEIHTGKRPYNDRKSASVENLYAVKEFPVLDGISPTYAAIIHHCWANEYTCVRDIEKELTV